MVKKIFIPMGPKNIMDTLEAQGYKAYVVGGCVRDVLLEKDPRDWDICTNATPEQVMECFSASPILKNGLKHNTVAISTHEGLFEVSSFRNNSKSIADDLAHRNFTINAMAYNDTSGIIDPYGGMKDLYDYRLSCVGDPDARFREDPLRIMRALRFSAVYRLDVAPDTADAIHRLVPLLKDVAAERIQGELVRLVFGLNAMRVLLEYSDVIGTVIPEMKPCIGFEQNNKYHQYNVYDHIIHATANYVGQDPVVKMALLLHDVGKPECYTEDENGGHFHVHGEPSAKLAAVAMKRLRFGKEMCRQVEELVKYHDSTIEPTAKTVRKWLNRMGEEQFRRLLDIRRADIMAHMEGTQLSRIERYLQLCRLTAEVIAQEQVFRVKDLAVSGKDILDLGVPQGKKIGMVLKALMDEVIAEELPNEKDLLLTRARALAAEIE